MAYSNDKKRQGLRLFLKGLTVEEIAADLKMSSGSIYNWRRDENWDELVPNRTVEQTLAARICMLSEKPEKTKLEIEELAVLVKNYGDLAVKLGEAEKKKAEARWIEKNGFPSRADGSQSTKGQGSNGQRTKGKAVKNDISSVTPEMRQAVMDKYFTALFYVLWFATKNKRNRWILKSRQIGATFYFSWEAFDDAIETGRNQIFLSASRMQAEVFKANIIQFALNEWGITLTGDRHGTIILSNGARLVFLSTNATTANSYSGNLYRDEVFSMPNFDKIYKMSGGISSQNRYHTTNFSIPLTTDHPAYRIWSGAKFNEGKTEKKKVKFDLSHATLKGGHDGADGVWRHIVNIEDAIEQGFTLHTIEMLKADGWSDAEFANLFMCEFLDAAKSVFNYEDLLACCQGTEELLEWPDYNKNADRPFENEPVAIGGDPAHVNNCAIVVLAVPKTLKHPFRLLRKDVYKGTGHTFQSNRIKDLKESHNAVHIGIDSQGEGLGVYENVREFYPRVMPFYYSIETKTRLVLNMLKLIESKRFRFLAIHTDVIRAFLMITQTQTASGVMTYVASMIEGNHADLFFAIAMACAYEELAPRRTATATVSIG